MKNQIECLILVCVLLVSPAAISFGQSKTEESTVPLIIHTPYRLESGDIGSLFGGNFGALSEAKIAILPLTGLAGELSPDHPAARIIQPFNTDASLVQFEIPADIRNDVWAIWAGNANGWSAAQYVNKAQPYWVSERTVYPGQKLTLGGRNFVNPTNRSADGAAVKFTPVGGGTAFMAKIIDVSDYTVHFRAPEGLVPGTRYDITYTNGAGGIHGVADMGDNVERERITAVAKNAALTFFDWFNADVTWLSGVKTDFIVSVTRYGARGDGKTDDTPAINAAINAINENGGGVLYFPKGVYLIDGISIGSNTAIEGAGQGVSILKWRRQAAGTMVTLNGAGVGVFDISIFNNFRRPNGAEVDFLGGYIRGVMILGGDDSAGAILIDVDVITADGYGVDCHTSGAVVIQSCHIDSSHAAFFSRPTRRVRMTDSTLWNLTSATIAFWDNLDAGFNGGQNYFANNRFIGDSINYRALNDDRMDDNYRSWNEILLDITEHRPADFHGEEMIFINNSIEGVYGDPASNAGEGITCQSISPKSFFGYVRSADSSGIGTEKAEQCERLVKNQFYLTIIGGPGIGQFRKIVDVKGDRLIVDRPWDILPTTESVYTVDSATMHRAVWANNHYSAATNKSSFGLWSKSYDMTIADNVITGGAGIWYGTEMHEDPNPMGIHWCFTQYFLTVSNNHIESWGNPWFLTAHASGIGPSVDGGWSVAYHPNYPASTAYGIRIVGNHVQAPNDLSDPDHPIYGNNLWMDYVVNPDGSWTAADGTMPKVPPIPQYLTDAARANDGVKPWWAFDRATGEPNETHQIEHYLRWVPYNGIFIAGNAEHDPFPSANGQIVDGNVVTNQTNGVSMGNRAWNTIVRNNTLIGNKNDGYRGIEKSVNTIELPGGNRVPGYAPRQIDKRALQNSPPLEGN